MLVKYAIIIGDIKIIYTCTHAPIILQHVTILTGTLIGTNIIGTDMITVSISQITFMDICETTQHYYLKSIYIDDHYPLL